VFEVLSVEFENVADRKACEISNNKWHADKNIGYGKTLFHKYYYFVYK
jgi:hypothetical protein